MSVTPLIAQEIQCGLLPNIPQGAKVLIVCDDAAESNRLNLFLRESGFNSECVTSITSGCAAARSGQFQVVVSVPQLADGSWKRLSDVAEHFDLPLEIVLWAKHFDLHQWSEALNQGAFDVLDAVFDMPRIAEVTKCALWAAYLRGARTSPTPVPLNNRVA